MNSSVDARTMSPNRVVGAVFGVVYVLVGLVGFAITTDTGFAATQGQELIFFELNPLHNIVHVAVGALLAAAAYKGAKIASGANLLVGAVYLLVGVLGLFLLDSQANLLALNHPDNALHLASAVILIGVGLTRR